ncbi:hypothetical protein KR222_009259 [Zaprionus bogoriensis]|nr:hypothetical protein KR222_009259 [Zaprionus bogoriensis]
MSEEVEECRDAIKTTDNIESTLSQKRQDYLSWNDYFMATALLSAMRSKDPVTQVGACIVDSHNRIIAIGYNGFPRNCSDDVFSWAKKNPVRPLEDKKLYVVHAEANAILNSKICLDGTRLYTTLFPCNECAKLIIQSGIRKIFFISDKYAYKAAYQASKRMLDAAAITYCRYIPTRKQIIIDFSEMADE